MIKFWFLAGCILTFALGVGLIGIFETLVLGDPDEWITVGQFIDVSIGVVISILTYKALSK